MSNEDIRQRAAIAVLPECVRETHEVLSNGGKLIEETQAKQAATMAVAYADELAEKLKGNIDYTNINIEQKDFGEVNIPQSQSGKIKPKFKVGDNIVDTFGNVKKVVSIDDTYYYLDDGKVFLVAFPDNWEKIELSNVSENGKNSKPANSCKISKDLQELTEFEKAFITSYEAYAEGFFTIMKWRDYAKLKSKQLIEIAYKQFREEENAIVTKQEFYKAVDEEIKRKCEKIDVDEMFDKVPPRILKTDFDFYKKGVVDTINKLKGE